MPARPTIGPRTLSRSNRRQHQTQQRTFASLPKLQLFPQPPVDPRRRSASTSSSNTDWLSWLKKASALKGGNGSDVGQGGKALLFAGLGSYPHTPQSPTPSSLGIWERASEALLNDDSRMGYETRGMEEFAGNLMAEKGIRGWMRGWVEHRTLDELMARADVTAAFILTSSIAILASEQERSGSSSMLPDGTTHLAGHGFLGTLTALVASGQVDLADGVRLARIYASLPPPPSSPSSQTEPSQRFMTTVLSARHFHSLAPPSLAVPFEDRFSNNAEECDGSAPESSSAPGRRRVMQLILDEIHALQQEWEGGKEWAEAGIINSSKVLAATGTQGAVSLVIERLLQLNLATPVLDVHMPCPYHTRLMNHAEPDLKRFLDNVEFRPPTDDVVILDPISTQPIENPSASLLSQLSHQLRWHKTLYRLYQPPTPAVTSFLTVGRGAKGLGVMLRGELKKRQDGAGQVQVEEYGVKEVGQVSLGSPRGGRRTIPRARM